MVFPSVTICNLNQLEQSFLVKINATIPNPKALINEYIEGHSGNVPQNQEEAVAEFKKSHSLHGPFFKQSSQSCENLLMSVNFRGKHYSWKNYTRYYGNEFDYPTDFGFCCFFVPHLFFEPLNTTNASYGELFLGLNATARNGEKNGLDIVLNAEQFNYAGLFQNSAGFKIALHNHLDRPIIQFSSDLLHPGTETQVKHIQNNHESNNINLLFKS